MVWLGSTVSCRRLFRSRRACYIELGEDGESVRARELRKIPSTEVLRYASIGGIFWFGERFCLQLCADGSRRFRRGGSPLM